MRVTGLSERCKFLFILFLLYNISFGQTSFPDSVLENRIISGINQLMVQDYDSSRTIFSGVINENKNSPLGYLYFAATDISEGADYLVWNNDERIESNLNRALELSEDLVDDDDSLIWNHYYLALVNSYFAYFERLRGNYFSALDKSYLAVSEFNICLEIDSNFTDAYLATGTFMFWKSKLSSFVEWLPFTEDKRDESIVLLKQSVTNSSFNKYLAALSLVWVYIDETRTEEAIELIDKILGEFPANRQFLWAKYSAYMNVNKEMSLEALKKIKLSFDDEGKWNDCLKLLVFHKMAMLYDALGDDSSAVNICTSILSQINQKDIEDCEEYSRYEKMEQLLAKLGHQ